MKYLVKHWINVDMIAEEVIDGDGVNFEKNDLGKYNEPSDQAKYVVSDYIKVKRRTIEQYDKKSNIIGKNRTSDK